MRRAIALLTIVLFLLGTGVSQRRKSKHKAAPKPKVVSRHVTVNVVSSADMICSTGECPTRESVLKLSASTVNTGDTFSYSWSVSGGKIAATGNSVVWDLKGALPGIYTAFVKVSDQHSGTGDAQLQIKVVPCGNCTQESSPCPLISVSCPDEIVKGSSFKFAVNIAGGPTLVTPTYLWTVSSGKIVKGDREKELEVVASDDDPEIRGTVLVSGYDPNCSTIGSCTSKLKTQSHY
jgi:hypothetical protein